ncbi:MAG TPA: hypothetical protein VIU93_12170 [Gallionellaceae bacterium]
MKNPIASLISYLGDALARSLADRRSGNDPARVGAQAAKKFSLKVDYLAAQRVVKITTRGILTLEANNELVAAAVAAGAQFDTNLFLVDDRNIELAMDIVNIYDLPEHNSQLGIMRNFRVALVFTPTQRNSELFKFYEDRVVITDFQQRVFTDEPAALMWLMEGQKA